MSDRASAADNATPSADAARAACIHVCVSCREPGDVSAERPGKRLYEALRHAAALRSSVPKIVPVECLSVCKRPCTIGFAAPGKWTYVYGDFAAGEAQAEAILDAAALYAQAPDGIIPWRQRPDALKKGVVARIPPLSTRIAPDLPEAAE